MKSLLVTITVILAGQLVSAQLCRFTDQFIQLPGLCNYFIRCSEDPPIVDQCPTGYVFSSTVNGCVETDGVYDDCSAILAPPSPPNTTDAPSEPGPVKHLYGPLSEPRAGGVSDVTCPDGSYAINCACSRPETCDGTAIIGNTRCLAVNGRAGLRQKALGVCLYQVDGQIRTAESTTTLSPEAICPTGFRVIACTLLYYGNRASDVERVRPSLEIARNSCQTSAQCPSGRGCRVQAVCQRI